MSLKGWAERRVHLPQSADDTQMMVMVFVAKGYHQIMFCLVSTRTSRSLSASLLSNQSVPQPVVFCGVICSQVLAILPPGLWASLCWTVWGSSQPISLTCWSSFKWQHTHVMLFFPVFCIIIKLTEDVFWPIIWIIVKRLDSSRCHMNARDTTSDWLPDGPYAIWQNLSSPEV